jgi:serine/threonine protein kinase
MDSPMFQPGQILPVRQGETDECPYQLQRLLGENPGRQTWLALDPTQQEPVVVKLLAFGGTMQWDELKLFEREAMLLRQLSHAKIPKYRDSFSLDDRTLWFGLVQDYINGPSLKDLLQQGHRFSEAEVRRIATQVLTILRYLHSSNPPVLHRDLKPSNIILDADNSIYLVDFGAAQDRGARAGATFTVVGTYGYAPLEQFGGRAVAASDLYALGATLIHLLTGTAPAELPQRDMRIQWHDLATVTPSFQHWLDRLTEPSVEKRWQTAQAAISALTDETALRPSTPAAALVNTSGQGRHGYVPEEILGWNWGAFLLPNIWFFTNKVWGWGLLTWIPLFGFAATLVLARRGNEMAWQSRRWRSVEQFKAHQRGWAIAGLVLGLPNWWTTLAGLNQAFWTMVVPVVSGSVPVSVAVTAIGAIILVASALWGLLRNEK